MPELLDERVRGEVRELLSALPGPVRLLFFTQEHACAACREQRQLLEEVAALSERVSLEVHDLVADAETAQRYGVSRVPTTAVVGARDHGIRFIGLTGGYEFASLLEAIAGVAAGRSGLEPELESLVARIDRPVHLEVMVTLTCPYCPRMVRLAHQMAIANPLVRADMVDAAEFPDLVQRYQVSGVPRTVVDGRPAFEGALPPESAILEILKLVTPAVYDEIDAARREERGERRVRPLEPGHRYDVLVVGAGPAAMAAVIYAVRKDLDVGLLGDRVGGQIADTAQVENWLGVPEIGGADLAAAFRDHAERHVFAERLGGTATEVARAGGGFVVRAADGAAYEARTVIYCAGKQYRRLGVPGEGRFLGHGVAFCATCDAPLYRDRHVVVVGGGNSAFSAARDLLPFAAEIHLVNILPDWQADPVLFDRVASDPRVRLHPAMEVREYLGGDHLTGVRLEAADHSERFDLAADGVFLEIGLVPNSDPVKGLLALNGQGEVPVRRDQSTAVPGFFAAGDVTDEPEKQILVAAAAGAKAALAAYAHLLREGDREGAAGVPAAAAAASAAPAQVGRAAAQGHDGEAAL